MQSTAINANDRLKDRLHSVGRVFHSVFAFAFICTPASRAQEVGLRLGAMAAEARLRKVARQGWFLAVPARSTNALQPGL